MTNPDHMALIVIQGALFVFTLGTNLASLAYVNVKLKLNAHLLHVLKLHLYVVVVGILGTIVGYSLVDIFGVYHLYTCSLYFLPGFAVFVSSYLFPTAIAVLR